MEFRTKRIASRRTVVAKVGAVTTALALASSSVPAVGLTQIALADEAEIAVEITSAVDAEVDDAIADADADADDAYAALAAGLYLTGETDPSAWQPVESGDVTLVNMLDASDDSLYLTYVLGEGKGDFGVNYWGPEGQVTATYNAATSTLTVKGANSSVKPNMVFQRWATPPWEDGGEIGETINLGTSAKLNELVPADGEFCTLDINVEEDRTGLWLWTEDGDPAPAESGELTGDDAHWYNYDFGDERGGMGVSFDDDLVTATYNAEAGTVTFEALVPGWEAQAKYGVWDEATGEEAYSKTFDSATVKLADVEVHESPSDPDNHGGVHGSADVVSNHADGYWFDDEKLAKQTPGVAWQQDDDGAWYATVDGERTTGWITYGTTTIWSDDGERIQVPVRFYLEDGVPATGVHSVDGTDYLFAFPGYENVEEGEYPGGMIVTGWIEEEADADGVIPYYQADGFGRVLKNTFVGAWDYDEATDTGTPTAVYMGADGKAVVGWQEIDGATYYFDPTITQETWEDEDGTTESFLVQGYLMFIGEHEIDGKTYTFGADGKLVGDVPATSAIPATDPQREAGKDLLAKWKASGNQGAFQHWVDVGDGTLEGALWATYDADGKLVTNEWLNYTKFSNGAYKVYADDWYYVDDQGEMLVGFQTLKFGKTEETYYFNPVHDGSYGKMLAGWHTIDGVEYYFSETHDGTYGKLVKDATR